MKKFIFSFVLCIMSITGFVYNAHALNPYAVMQEAKNGLVGSQFLLGVLYSTGAESDVIEPNPHKAREWYEKAAQQGHPAAQYLLGSIYETGQFVDRDIKKAVMWYEKAANNGITNAQFRMGEFYEKGLGVEQDIEKAIAWYKKAATQNNLEAQAKLKKLQKTAEAVTPQPEAPQTAETTAAQPAR